MNNNQPTGSAEVLPEQIEAIVDLARSCGRDEEELVSAYKAERMRGLSHLEAHELIGIASWYTEVSIEECSDFYWIARGLGVPHFEAIALMDEMNVADPDFFERWPYYVAQREQGLDPQRASELVNIGSSYVDVSIEEAIEFYWHVRQLGGSHNDALAVMKEDNVADPDFFERWPYYLALRDKGLSWWEVNAIMDKASHYSKVTIDDFISFYWRVRGLGLSHREAMMIGKEDVVASPTIFELWPYYEALCLELKNPRDAIEIIQAAVSQPDKSVEELITLYRDRRKAGNRHYSAMRVIKK
jgi:hypothetical protein